MNVIIWAAVIIVAVILEALTTQIVSIWFAGGGLAGLIAALCHASEGLQVSLALGVTLVLLLVTRPIANRIMQNRAIPTNADRVIGEIGVVTCTVDNTRDRGRVSVLGNDWRAVSSDGSRIEEGSYVTVECIDGAKIVISPVK